MTRLTIFLALATAWCADAVLMFGLAEARWGSIMYRMFAGMLLALALIALLVAVGPQTWRSLEPRTLRALVRARRAFRRLSTLLWVYWTLIRATRFTHRPVTSSQWANPTP